eukprot:10797793-Ditylum_brightwellii.AAC.1
MLHMITFRVGMIMKNIHTFFEYVKGSENMDISTTKNIAGWDDVVDNNVFGGYSPACDNISIEIEKSPPSSINCSVIKKASMVM